jgi:hypothetical protein
MKMTRKPMITILGVVGKNRFFEMIMFLHSIHYT